MKSIYLQLTQDDVPYLGRLKSIVGGRGKFYLGSGAVNTITEVVMKAKEKGADAIATTSPELLKLLIDANRKPSIDDYAGSIIDNRGMEFLIIQPLEQLMTVNYGAVLLERYMSKLLHPEKWMQLPEFDWRLFNPKDTDEWIDAAHEAEFIAVDIETGPENERIITCCGFTFINFGSGTISAKTLVIPFDDVYNIEVAKVLLQTATPKVLQNGKYDMAYLLRYRLPVRNWEGDTLNLFHSWYSELPKRLDFIASFTLRKWQFWKSESQTTDLMEYYRYNAKDCFATAMVWITLIREVPSFALLNYTLEFPIVFPCLLAEMTGLKRDDAFMQAEEQRFNSSLEVQLANIRKLVGNPYYNPNSPPQTLALFKALGSGDITSSDKIHMDKVMHRHPINKRILSAVKKLREDRKMAGTYLRRIDPKSGKDKVWHDRIFFSESPSGTDTGRIASKESAFWCGWNITNIPRDRDDIQVKRGIVADDGFFFGECDYSQAETRGTAYLSGDTNLINTVNDKTKDFHGWNASQFFGLPYSTIVESEYDEAFEEWVHKTVNKVIRDLSKRTNHGANYNMGASVLLDTMGISNVIRAKALLKLPAAYSLLRVCQFLLDRFDATYPILRNDWYKKCIGDVKSSKMLVGPTGWTRYCFGHPDSNKRDLNAYVAHPPQSLNAMCLNMAYNKVFHNISLRLPREFKLGPQIHDSILFQYKIGATALAFQVAEEMRLEVNIRDTFGVTRGLVVPTDLKGESRTWADVKPMRQLKHEKRA